MIRFQNHYRVQNRLKARKTAIKKSRKKFFVKNDKKNDTASVGGVQNRGRESLIMK